MYRSDGEAARARIEALEAQLRRVTDQLGQIERSARDGCTSREHARQMDRIAELVDAVELAKERAKADAAPIGRTPADQVAIEEQVTELQRELRDLETMGRGDQAMLAEIATYQADITRLEPAVTNLEQQVAEERTLALALGHDCPVWARPRPVVRELVRRVAPVGLGLAAVAEVANWWWLGGGPGALAIGAICAVAAGWMSSCVKTEHRIERALVGADEICGARWVDAREIRFSHDGAGPQLTVELARRTLVFRGGSPRFDAVVNAARLAAPTHKVPIVGELPALPEGDS